MKRLFLVAAFALLATPYFASAHEDHDKDDKGPRRPRVNATEFAGAGLAAAALIGVAGYAMLRRRTRQD